MEITLREALSRYRLELASLGLSATHQRITMVYLGKFLQACESTATEADRGDAEALPVTAVTPESVTAYFAGLDGLTQATRTKALVSLRKFLGWMEQREYIKPGVKSKLIGERKVKPSVRRPKHYIPVNQFSELLELSGRRHPADRAAMAVALYTLARQGEIASLKLRDVDFERGTIRINRHKRGRWSDVTICPDLHAELVEWMYEYAKACGYPEGARWRAMKESHPDWYLIPHLAIVRNKGAYSAPLMEWELEPDAPAVKLAYVVKDALDVLGSTAEHGQHARHLGEGMHTIRRSGARAMLDHLAGIEGNDKALLQVSIMLDHEDPKMTLLYIGRDLERDRLNDYLRTGSMYGPAHRQARTEDNVVQLRREA